MRRVPPVAPVVSLVLLLPGSAGGEKSNWSSLDDGMLYLSHFFKPLLPLYNGLFPRWMRQINPIDLGNVPSGASGYVFPKLSPNVGPPPQRISSRFHATPVPFTLPCPLMNFLCLSSPPCSLPVRSASPSLQPPPRVQSLHCQFAALASLSVIDHSGSGTVVAVPEMCVSAGRRRRSNTLITAGV